MKTYNVRRQHYGDKQYVAGDQREANEADVKHLVAAGVLEEVSTKSEKAPANKAEKAALKNKSAD